MDIKQLKRFLDICRTGSFTKTAENLYISQQALSSSISTLEEELGRPIFTRTATGVIPTEDGLFLKEVCTPVVQSFDDMTTEIYCRFDTKKGRLVLGLVPEVLLASIPDLLLRFRKTYTNIELKTIENLDTQCVDDVINGTVELAFCPRPHDSDLPLEYIHLRDEKIYAVINKNSSLSQKKTISVSDLKDERIVTLNRYHQIYYEIMDCCKANGFTPRFEVETGESSILLSMVKTNECVFICMEHVAVNMDKSSCVKIPISDKGMVWEYGLIYKKDKKLCHSARQFVNYLSHVLLPQTSKSQS